jgi:hypothetical protein
MPDGFLGHQNSRETRDRDKQLDDGLQRRIVDMHTGSREERAKAGISRRLRKPRQREIKELHAASNKAGGIRRDTEYP